MAAALLAGCGGSGGEPAPSAPTTTPPATAPAEADVIATVEGAEGGEITGGDLEQEVLAAASAEGRTPPTPGSPEFDLLAGDAFDRLLLRRWVAAEAAEQGVEATDEQVAAQAEQLSGSEVRGLREAWGERTECDPGLVSRLCGDGGEQQPPPDIPPASG